ncbi:MAG: hypothetical protein HY695_30295 [Deltaproteobacteria bacterium]|nr:hypothetical protein [Deltaproteobacteria bacterium]
MIVGGTQKYFRAQFDDEAEIEKVVKDYAEYLFGSSILFIPKSKITTAGGVGTIPDGFVMDVEAEDWFIVEAELAAHGTWQHIAPQVSKQITAVDSQATRDTILKVALDVVKSDKAAADVFSDLGVAQLDIHGTLQAILKKPPTIAIPIDGVPADLQSWARTLKFNVKIWVIEKYKSADGKTVVYSIPDENVPTITTGITAGQPTSTAVARWSQPYRDVMEAGLIKEEQRVLLDYGPRGKLKQTFQGILRKEGVEIDGQVMSLSAAAVYCIQKSGSPRPTANGWMMWKTEDGIYLNEFYNKVYASTAAEAGGLVQQPAPADG